MDSTPEVLQEIWGHTEAVSMYLRGARCSEKVPRIATFHKMLHPVGPDPPSPPDPPTPKGSFLLGALGPPRWPWGHQGLGVEEALSGEMRLLKGAASESSRSTHICLSLGDLK